MMRVLGVFLRLSAWAIGLGALASQLAYRSNVSGGVLLAAACAVLMWRVVVVMGLPIASRPADDPALFESRLANRGA